VSAEAVVDAARRRSAALAARDADALRALHHPALRWTTHRGEVLDREDYVRGNTAGDLVWRGQRLEDAQVTVAGDTAVLTALAIDDVERAGAAQTFRVRVTLTWVREGGEWLCLAGHAG
jgi:ketosteroid isomerase-like protein